MPTGDYSTTVTEGGLAEGTSTSSVARTRQKRIRVALVDYQPVVRGGLEASLARRAGLAVVVTASDVEEAFRGAAESPPDVFIVDADAPAAAARRIRRRFPHAKVLVFSSADSEGRVQEAARGAIHAFVRRTASADDIVRAIETVHSGGTSSSAGTLRSAVATRASRYRDAQLTRRERQVVKLVAEGNTGREIASLLRVSIRTIESHRRNIARKLGIRTAAGLTRFAVETGLVETD